MEYKLKDIITFKPGYAFKKSDMTDTGIDLVKIGNLKNNKVIIPSGVKIKEDTKFQDFIINKGDILMALTGDPVYKGNIQTWVGRTSIYLNNKVAYLNQRVCKLIPNEKIILGDYLYYWLIRRDKTYEIAGLFHGSANQANISHKEVGEMFIELPSLEIQKKASNILSDIDKKIELNNEINNNLYEEAVALYKDKFKEIGQSKKTIGDYIVPKRGKNLLTRDAIDGDTPVVAGGIAPSAYHNQFNTKSPVITISASGANAGYTNLWNIPVWASDCSYIDDSITKNVYFWYIILKTRQNEIFDAQTGSAQPHIYPQHIAEMSIGELNIAEVEKYNNLVAPLFKMIGENQKENKKLSQLRDTLLPKLMNGEIDLDNIEI